MFLRNMFNPPTVPLRQSQNPPRQESQSPTENLKSPEAAPTVRIRSFGGGGAHICAPWAAEHPILSTVGGPRSAQKTPLLGAVGGLNMFGSGASGACFGR